MVWECCPSQPRLFWEAGTGLALQRGGFWRQEHSQEGVGVSTRPCKPPPPPLGAPCSFPSSSTRFTATAPQKVGVGQSPGAPSPLPICMFRVHLWIHLVAMACFPVPLAAEWSACQEPTPCQHLLGALLPSGGVGCFFFLTSPSLPAPGAVLTHWLLGDAFRSRA